MGRHDGARGIVTRLLVALLCVSSVASAAEIPQSRYETLGELDMLVLGVAGGDGRHWLGVHESVAIFNDFIVENSYGQAWINPTILGLYNIPLGDHDCKSHLIRAAVYEYAENELGLTISDFDYVVVVIPDIGCGWFGMAGGGHVVLQGTSQAAPLMHEVGHAMGLGHNARYACKVDGVTAPLNLDGCTLYERGDGFSPVGGGIGHYSPVHKAYLRWANVVDVETTGTYRLTPLEVPGGTHVLRVRSEYDRGAGAGLQNFYYYLSYRQFIGFDSNTRVAQDENGVLFHVTCWYVNATRRNCAASILTDQESRTGEGYSLKAGQGWTDPGERGIGFEVLPGNVTGAGGYVDVRITVPGAPGPDPAQCSVPPVVVSPGGSMPYRVTVRDAGGIPLPGLEVRLEFSPEADSTLCWCAGQEHPTITAVTDTQGVATLRVAGGGCIPADLAPVRVFAGGVLLRAVGVVSPDVWDTDGRQHPDCVVGLPDAVGHTGPVREMRYSFCSDLDGDGAVGLGDAVLLTDPVQAGHNCQPVNN
jgi:hypothetical protein